MQSPATAFFRASVMLVCLIAIPAAALMGGKLPESIRSWLSGEAPAAEVRADANTEAPPVEMGEFGPPGLEYDGFVPGSTDRRIEDTIALSVPRTADPPSEQMPAAEPQVDRFVQLQQSFRQLGATYYRLESWGKRQELYRFHCRMAVGGDPSFTRCFEATHGNPMAAMEEVLGQVRQWRTSQSGRTAVFWGNQIQ